MCLDNNQDDTVVYTPLRVFMIFLIHTWWWWGLQPSHWAAQLEKDAQMPPLASPGTPVLPPRCLMPLHLVGSSSWNGDLSAEYKQGAFYIPDNFLFKPIRIVQSHSSGLTLLIVYLTKVHCAVLSTAITAALCAARLGLRRHHLTWEQYYE